MTRTNHRQRWDSPPKPTVNLGSSTIVRVFDRGEQDADFVRRPVGFTAVLTPLETEPLLWEGDQA